MEVLLKSKLFKGVLWSGIAAFVSGCILCVSLAFVFFHVNRTLSGVDTAVSNVNTTLIEVNRPCSKTASCGTLADLDRTLATMRGTMGQIELAAKHENAQLGTLDIQERTLYADLHGTLQAGQKTLSQGTELLNTTNETVKKIQPVLTEAQGTLRQSTEAVAGLTDASHSLNAVLADPSIPATLKATQHASEELAGASVEVKGMAVEGHQWLHSLLHPTWPSRVYHVGLDLAHAFNPF